MTDGSGFEEIQVEFVGAEGNRLVGTRFSPDQGSKFPPILFMHGGGQTRHSWNGTARRVARHGYACFTIDSRGHGDSAWVDSQNYRFADFSADLTALALEITEDYYHIPPILIGASMGGLSAMLAQSGGENASGTSLFSAIILVDITPRMESAGVDKIIGFMSENMREGFATVEEAADVVASYLPHRARPKSLVGLQKNLRQRENGRWYWHWDPAFVDGERNITVGEGDPIEVFTQAAGNIDVPTLLVRGANSELVSKQAAEEFLQLVPHSKFIDVNDAGHMIAGDKNDIFAEAVIGFLKSDLENPSE